MVQEFGLRMIFSPTVYGLWNYVTVLKNFGSTLDLGVATAASRKIAIENGQGSKEIVGKYCSSALIINGYLKAITAIFIVGYAIYFTSFDLGWLTQITAIATAVIMVILIGFTDVYVAAYQGIEIQDRLGKLIAIFWAIFCATSIAFGYIFGISGVLFSGIFSYLIYALILHHKLRDSVDIRWAISWDKAKDLLGFGIPFRVVDYPLVFLSNADLLLVAMFFDVQSLAIYSTAKIFLLQTSQIPGWILSIFVMKLANKMNNSFERAKCDEEMYLLLLFNYFVLIPLLLVFTVLGSKVIMHVFLVDYIPALDYVLLIMFALYFQPQVTGIRNYWMLEKKLKKLAITNIISLAVFFIVIFIGNVDIDGLTVIVTAYVLANCINALLGLFSIGPKIWGWPKLLGVMLAGISSVSLYAYFISRIETVYLNSSFGAIEAGKLMLESVIFVPMILIGGWYVYSQVVRARVV
jgi:O-antigen/teichoic acid export membrane protein